MKISLIIPVLNEEETIPIFYERITTFDALDDYELEFIFINDGSRDKTEELIERLAVEDARVVLLSFSRCFGKESAMMAGFAYATGDASIPIDVDLQDPIEIIPEMIKHWEKGYSVVLAKRSSRRGDSFFKRFFATKFYSLYNAIAPLKIEFNVGDYRLLDKAVVAALLRLSERQLFMKGLFAWLGFSQYIVEFERQKRVAGKSKFNGWKLWNFAIEGVTSFSTLPLRIWSYIGFVVAFVSFCYAGVMILEKLLYDNAVPGYPSLMTAMLFLGGVQLIGIGVLGEYVGRIYMEAKRRPRYILQKIVRRGVEEAPGALSASESFRR